MHLQTVLFTILCQYLQWALQISKTNTQQGTGQCLLEFGSKHSSCLEVNTMSAQTWTQLLLSSAVSAVTKVNHYWLGR